MPLSDDDVREILRLIDESDGDELRVELEGLSLYVRRGGDDGAPAVAEPEPAEVPTIAGSGEVGDMAGGLHTVASPMLGTFYRAQAPGAPPFVDVGARVEPDTVVCLIEVMKMMNAVPAGVAGTIVEACVENAQLVEDGAPLFRIRSDR